MYMCARAHPCAWPVYTMHGASGSVGIYQNGAAGRAGCRAVTGHIGTRYIAGCAADWLVEAAAWLLVDCLLTVD